MESSVPPAPGPSAPLFHFYIFCASCSSDQYMLMYYTLSSTNHGTPLLWCIGKEGIELDKLLWGQKCFLFLQMMPTLPETLSRTTPTHITRIFLWVTLSNHLLPMEKQNLVKPWSSLDEVLPTSSAETGRAHWTVLVHSHVHFLLVTPTKRQWQLVAIREEKCHCIWH